MNQQEPAFELLRQFKNVSVDTELLTMKVIKKRFSHLNPQDLYNIFEMGIQGEFGKLYQADPQTLIGWVEDYCKKANKKVSYYERPILPPSVKITDRDYPTTYEDWQQEVNKAYIAFLGGTPTTSMHPDIYSRLSLDGRIHINAYKEYYTNESDWDISRQKVMAKYFTDCKLNGLNEIYHVSK
jgi:hypothetical protein